MSAENKA